MKSLKRTSQSPRGRGKYSTLRQDAIRLSIPCLNPLAVGVGIQLYERLLLCLMQLCLNPLAVGVGIQPR